MKGRQDERERDGSEFFFTNDKGVSIGQWMVGLGFSFSF
jgi:hypothetical protein